MSEAGVLAGSAEGPRRFPVLIAGGGPSGLALAGELGWRRISCLVVEQGDGDVEFPTTNLVNTRTCEHLRRWGLAARVRYDAAHLLWPAGGFGINTGVGDSVDLGWKLAAILQGWGDPRLLDSYEPERRPIGMRNVNEAGEMRAGFDSQIPFSPLLEEDGEEGRWLREKAREAILRTRAKEFQHDSAGIELGYRYDSSPICIPNGTPPPPNDHAIYAPTTWPGARAPHVWLRDGRSTLDLFGRGFTLLVLSSKIADTSAFTSAAQRAGLPLEVVTLDEPQVRESYECPLVLVRPDGHVAWRGDSVPVNAAEIIERVRGARA